MMDYYLNFCSRKNGSGTLPLVENEDTEKGLSDFVPFKNLFNEWFAKDTSRKVKPLSKRSFRLTAYHAYVSIGTGSTWKSK